ncbi:lycopene cyclase domain-containing protein [Mucilaginibacter flavidus]|uniref:lycopene cyclase domain-containing protein n=1 Tax=Mucilaginibacter flavidus TaxID=2949309 RepID=UPI002092A9B2|nr:lycopene cyclase domain-containing protein [Mucilaginibacter flavidus]MCO5949856.1 lycopene cyclase domain-containing protein [Mucilaginibacter flavidus]
MRFTYLLIDIFSVIVPFIFSFHPRLRFYKQWPALLPAMLITGIVFIAWDMYFTRLKIWGFNATYLTGINVGNLPLEEILFFLCIPYSCGFTYACFKLIIKKDMSRRSQLIASSLLIVASVFMALRFYNQAYTCSAFAVLAVLIFVAQYLLKAGWLSKFYITYLYLLLPFLIVNGLLTGTGLKAPVVWYNPEQIVNIRILSIPVEDVFYGMDLILLNITIYSLLSARIYQRNKSRRKTHAMAKYSII